jgi:hypothetical protein
MQTLSQINVLQHHAPQQVANTHSAGEGSTGEVEDKELCRQITIEDHHHHAMPHEMEQQMNDLQHHAPRDSASDEQHHAPRGSATEELHRGLFLMFSSS